MSWFEDILQCPDLKTWSLRAGSPPVAASSHGSDVDQIFQTAEVCRVSGARRSLPVGPKSIGVDQFTVSLPVGIRTTGEHIGNLVVAMPRPATRPYQPNARPAGDGDVDLLTSFRAPNHVRCVLTELPQIHRSHRASTAQVLPGCRNRPKPAGVLDALERYKISGLRHAASTWRRSPRPSRDLSGSRSRPGRG